MIGVAAYFVSDYSDWNPPPSMTLEMASESTLVAAIQVLTLVPMARNMTDVILIFSMCITPSFV